jgi:hypothetical protein
MEVSGKLTVINATQVISEKFSKRTFVVETADQYPQQIELQLTQDKCDYLDQYSLGEQINVSINIRGRAWTNPAGEVKYFNTLEAWKIQRLDGRGESIQEKARVDQMKAHAPNEEEDDLPF